MEILMWFRSLIRFVKRSASRPPFRQARRGASRRRPAHCRLSVEALGDRLVPASLSVGDLTLVEGNAGTQYAAVRVSLDAPSNKTVTVNYGTADGTAVAGSDYQAVSGKLTFARGETTKTVLVPVTGDQLVESNESFSVNLSGARHARIADGRGVVTIVDDDDDRPHLSINDVWARDGDSGTTLYTFTVSLSAALGEAVTVNYATADGTAMVADGDYLATSGTLTFAPGETTKTITVEVIGNASGGSSIYSGYAETFSVNLSGASGNALVIDGQGVGTIHYFDIVMNPGPGCDPSDENYPNC
jgi:hypothetical protein